MVVSIFSLLRRTCKRWDKAQ